MDESPKPELSVIIPCKNEALVLDKLFTRLLPILDRLDLPYEVICINDGSDDDTLKGLLEWARKGPRIVVIDLSRSFGKEAALTAGIDHARGAAVIPMDADLQDPPELIPEMIGAWRSGAEIVLARRTNRESDSVLKRLTAKLFYRVHNAISNTPVPENVGDFRLINRQALDAIMQLRERHRFMKGLFAWVGFRQVEIGYVRPPRAGGQTQFSGRRLWNLAMEGFTSFTTLPLRIWTYIGLTISSSAFIYGAWTIARTLIFGIAVPGYASLLTLVLFFGGLNLLGLGIIGEYLGRVFMETKQRPLYVVRSVSRDTRPAAQFDSNAVTHSITRTAQNI